MSFLVGGIWTREELFFSSVTSESDVVISGTTLCMPSITGKYTYLQETEGRRGYFSAANNKYLYFSPKGRLYGIWRWYIGGTLVSE